MTEFILIVMVIFAILTVQTNSLRRAIIYLAVFSLLCSFSYLLYQAPDVAIAEAIIGCTLSTVLYLVALKKYKVFRVYYSAQNLQMRTDVNISQDRSSVIHALREFSLEIELELDIVNTSKDVNEIIESYPYDIIIDHEISGMIIHGDKSNYHFDDLITYFSSYSFSQLTFNFLESDGDDVL